MWTNKNSHGVRQNLIKIDAYCLYGRCTGIIILTLYSLCYAIWNFVTSITIFMVLILSINNKKSKLVSVVVCVTKLKWIYFNSWKFYTIFWSCSCFSFNENRLWRFISASSADNSKKQTDKLDVIWHSFQFSISSEIISLYESVNLFYGICYSNLNRCVNKTS